jgi:general stress protein 26
MTTPVTALDPRYSDPKATAISWDQTREALEAAELSWISTVRPDGRPHVTPLVAVWAGGAVHFHTGAGEQKAANLRANPHVVLTTGCNRWDGGLDVVVEGAAARVTDEDVLRRLAEAWAAKWDGRWRVEVRDGCFYQDGFASQVFSVRPVTVYAYAKGDPFGHTSHRFAPGTSELSTRTAGPGDVPADAMAAVLVSVLPGYILQLALLGPEAVDGIPEAVRALWP